MTADHRTAVSPLAPLPRDIRLIISLLIVAGYILTLVVFFPGHLTADAAYVYGYMKDWSFGDWQSPVMIILWRIIDPIAPGSGSMFLLVTTLYWAGFGLVALAVARRSIWIGMTVPFLALAPPGVMMLVMIWRDMLFGVTWLLAAAIIYTGASRPLLVQMLAQCTALALIVFGVLLRPPAIVAAPILAAYALWPARFHLLRTLLVYVPGLVIGYAAIHVVYYVMLDARRENPLHSLLVFDLGGITHFTGVNQFPVIWNDSQNALLTTRCYNTERWDAYWTMEPCSFVMKRLEGQDAESNGQVIFGTSRLSDAWLAAVTAHPIAYLQHRASHFWRLLSGANLTLETYRIDDPNHSSLTDHRLFKIVLGWHDRLKSTLLFRLGFWLALATVFGALAWPLRHSRSGAFIIGTTGSAVAFVGTFFLVGVAGDFRYGYWCVLASLVSFPTWAAAMLQPRVQYHRFPTAR